MKVGIDFDGVICEREGIPRKTDFFDCPPTQNCENALKFLLKQGYDLYVFTNRDPKEWKKIQEWMKLNELPKLRVTNIKEPATSVYIDDRAVRFTCWLDICKLFG